MILGLDIDVELIADDRYENCEDVATQTGAVALMPHRSYNRMFSHPKVRRIQELCDLFNYLASATGARTRYPTGGY